MLVVGALYKGSREVFAKADADVHINVWCSSLQ